MSGPVRLWLWYALVVWWIKHEQATMKNDEMKKNFDCIVEKI